MYKQFYKLCINYEQTQVSFPSEVNSAAHLTMNGSKVKPNDYAGAATVHFKSSRGAATMHGLALGKIV